MQQVKRTGWSNHHSYLLASIATASIALVFSFLYSRDLGAQNRGIIGVVFLASLMFTTVFLGGLNLTFRAHETPIATSTHSVAFCLISFFSAFVNSMYVFFICQIYSMYKSSIPSNLVYAAMIYSFTSVLLNQIFQLLLALDLITLRWRLDLMVVILQVVVFYTVGCLEISVANRVLLSFATSYSFAFGLVSIYLAQKRLLQLKEGWTKETFLQLIQSSKNNHAYTSLLALLDRIDRIFVLVLFPTSTFGVYSFVTGFISSARFIPESVSAMIVAGKLGSLENRLHFRTRTKRVLAVFSSALVGAISFLITGYTFSSFGLISLLVPMIFALSEILRGVFVTRLSFYVKFYASNFPMRSVGTVLSVFVVFALLTYSNIGLLSMPVALALGYALSFLFHKSLRAPSRIREYNE